MIELALVVTVQGPVLFPGNVTRLSNGFFYITYDIPAWAPEGDYSITVLSDCQLVGLNW